MTDGAIAAACATGMFVTTVAIGLAGADKPPPPGFLLLVGVVGVLGVVAFNRLKTHLTARRARRPRIGLRVGLEGMAAGASAALTLSLLGGGEPSVVVSLASRLIGVGVVALAGSVLALMVWLVAAQLQTRIGGAVDPELPSNGIGTDKPRQ